MVERAAAGDPVLQQGGQMVDVTRRQILGGTVLEQGGTVADLGGDKAKQDDKAKQKASAEALKKYAGRYELEVGVLPVSTLDVTLADGELWMKPSLVKRRRLLRKSKSVFTDEVEGTPVTFNRDDTAHCRVITATGKPLLESTYEGLSVAIGLPVSRG